jgi:hypothetical protein
MPASPFPPRTTTPEPIGCAGSAALIETMLDRMAAIACFGVDDDDDGDDGRTAPA